MKTATQKTLGLLRAHEPANMLWVAPDGSWPIVWESAKGAKVRDAEGREYIDLTAAFGVAAAGHANARVVAAGQRQMAKLLHAMGDVHPHALKAELARELSRLTFERWTKKRVTAKTMFANSGFEAVEMALKTAMLATGRKKILAFTGAYHGLGYGALNATHRDYFRKPFQAQLGRFGAFVPFPTRARELAPLEKEIAAQLRTKKIGAVLVEPIQGRGGVNVPPAGFLPMLRKLCDRFGALLVLDEIYTGFGRTGAWFACEHSRTVPDLICLGKALTGGFPMSVCAGKSAVMDAAWPPSQGEAIHTSTFQGNPVGCAMALAQIQEIKRQGLPERSARLGITFIKQLREVFVIAGHNVEVRGRGLMIGVEIRNAMTPSLPRLRGGEGRGEEACQNAPLPNPPLARARRGERLASMSSAASGFAQGTPATELALDIVKKMLHRGFILLPEGESGNVISFSPPLTISEAQLSATLKALKEVLR